MMGFDNYHDFISFSYSPKFVGLFSIGLGTIGSLVELWTGISLYLWLFLTMASIFDIAFGVYANVVVLNQLFNSKRFFRGVFKSFIVLFIIVITNNLNLGVRYSKIEPEFLRVFFEGVVGTIHYSFVMLISLYLLTGISENGDKIQIPVFQSLTRMLKMKIRKVERFGDDLDPPINHDPPDINNEYNQPGL